MALPDAASVSGRSGTDVAALLACPAASVVSPVPLVVVEQVTTTATSWEQPNAAAVASEGVAHSMPPAAQVTTPDVGRAESDAAVMAFDGAA